MESFLKGRKKEKKIQTSAVNGCRLSDGAVSVQAEVLPEEPHPSPAVDEAAHSPKVEVVSEDGRVHRIVITCVCGQRTELVCEY